MPKDFLHHLWAFTGGELEGSEGVPKFVKVRGGRPAFSSSGRKERLTRLSDFPSMIASQERNL
jgi:hypothetical protein